jgi:LacI family transcriptional regulator
VRPKRTIAVILPVPPEYSSRLYEGAIGYAEEHRHVELLDLSYTRPCRSPLPKGRLTFQGALAWLNPRDTWVNQLLEDGIPVVTTSGDWPDTRVPVVAFDGKATVRLAAEHLASLHRLHAAYVGVEIQGNPVTEARARLFEALMNARGCMVRCCALESRAPPPRRGRPAGLSKRQSGRLTEFLQTQKLPAAVWCESDHIGLFVCEAAAKLGLRVPGDLAVLGCGDFRESHICRPPLSTIPQPGQLVGYRALEALERMLDGHRVRGQRIAVAPPPVIWRESTGCGPLEDNVVHSARRLIAEHACKGLTVNDVMRTVLLSQPTFTRRFRDVTGRSPAEEIRLVRVERAKYYLKDRHLSIGRIAGLCGYSEQNKFANFFKRETGGSPSMFRKQHYDQNLAEKL